MKIRIDPSFIVFVVIDVWLQINTRLFDNDHFLLKAFVWVTLYNVVWFGVAAIIRRFRTRNTK